MKDPAFLYYDGDAARDVSHMTRLERGCYFDLIQAQRKFGRLTLELIKKILGKDFDACWESVKICLSYDNDMYFIEWLENATIKRKEYSESRRKNRMTEKQQDTEIISKSYVNHMENENINEIVNESKSEITFYSDFDILEKELSESEIWLEQVAMNHSISIDLTKTMLKKFCQNLRARNEIGKRLQDYQAYFSSWTGKHKDDQGIKPYKMTDFYPSN